MYGIPAKTKTYVAFAAFWSALFIYLFIYFLCKQESCSVEGWVSDYRVIGCPRKFDVHNKYYIRGLYMWSLNMKFLRDPITHRAWDRRTPLFIWYNAKFWAKNADNCNVNIMSSKMEWESLQGDWRVHGSHFNACSS